MKTLTLSVLVIAGMALIALQHQQLGRLRAENLSLQQARAEADRLKADLANSTGTEADAQDEITRLREENRDLLKLRNQVYQLREATTQFEQVRAENLRLQSAARNVPNRDAKQIHFQPIIIQIQNLSYQGLGTPEAAVQTFLWAERDGNVDALSNCISPDRWSDILFHHGGVANIQNIMRQRRKFDGEMTIKIVARRNLDPNTVQLGIQSPSTRNPDPENKLILTLRFRDGDWKLDVNDFQF